MSIARDVIGNWLAARVQSLLPQLRREFDLNRDPLIRKQLEDLERSEKQRRDGSDTKGYFIPRKKQDKPAPALKPPYPLRQYAERESGLMAQRDAAFAHAVTKSAEIRPEQDRSLPPNHLLQEPLL